jgi:energy-coupling factor transporter transmembrane protein EcfT
MITQDPGEFSRFLVRFRKIGFALLFFSILQIIFRRSGEVLLYWQQMPIAYYDGVKEAVLLWVRFSILFLLAKMFSEISPFHLLVLMNRIKLPMKLNLLFLTTFRLIPFIYSESKNVLWHLRFRGINIQKLCMRDKFRMLKKLLFPLVIRGIHYTSYSALALELRGFGSTSTGRIPVHYPLSSRDIYLISITILLNIICLIGLR